MARKFTDVVAEMEADPVRGPQIAREVAALRRRYNRPWWKLIRLIERLSLFSRSL